MRFLIIFFLISFSLLGVVPNLIPIQGVLTESNGDPLNGKINLTLALYNSETDNDELWKEKRDDFTVENGYISLYLGEVTELDSSIISNAEELWLEIKFNDEVMPRVRLTSVPFALEAINAQKVKQIGEINDSQISNMFTSGCSDGFYLKGYDINGNSICAEDKTKNNQNIYYNAGYGINIDENNNISVVDNLYSTGNGIKLTNNIFSIDTTKVATTSHNHDTLYYRKDSASLANHILKFTETSIGYKLNSSVILEDNGNVDINKLTITDSAKSSNLISPNIITEKITGKNNHEIKINSNINFNGEVKANKIRVDGDINITKSGYNITADEIISTGIMEVPSISFSQNRQVMEMLKVVISDEASIENNYNNISKDYYIQINGDIDTNISGGLLTNTNSLCFLSMVARDTDTSFSNGNTDYTSNSGCKVYLDNRAWKLHIHSSKISIKCKATCLRFD